MFPRAASTKICQLARKFPAVSLLGPRQSGKTTLARLAFPKKPYVSFENQDVLIQAQRDPRAFLERFRKGAIFDEVQRVPELLSYLQGEVDERPAPGRFVLTGSHNLLLLEKVTQTLAGRIGFMNLLPMSFEELRKTEYADIDRDELIVNGGYPRLYNSRIRPTDFYPGYLLTYVERDVRQIRNISDLARFQRFLRVCATRVGQVVNYSSIGNDCGIDQKTVLSWLGLLEASFIAFRLQPYYRNLGKRLLQMPRLYFYDTGLCCSLLEIANSKHLAGHPLHGALFENFVVLELMKDRLNRGLLPNFYYWKDRTGNEVDVIIDRPVTPVPLEVKISSTFGPDFLKGIDYWNKINPGKRSYLVYSGPSGRIRNTRLTNWRDLSMVKN
jgi:hypothetical protein